MLEKMESWSYISRGQDFVPIESISGTDGITRNDNGLMGWELKASSSFETGAFMSSNQEGLKNPQFVELGYAETITTTPDTGSVTDAVTSKFGCRKVYSTPNAISSEEEPSSKLSGSVLETNFQDTPLIDLKLGRFPDHTDAQANPNPNFSSAESSMPSKKLRTGKLSSQIPFCQVYGCKKDLSNSKEYHKRHKVCEIHSKTAKVIVSGIDQRFCQQCSRFHLLSEFDGGKRSCRKRLAGHNERRRKPHVGIHSGRAGRFFQPYNGQRLPSASSSGGALSLLSFQSQNPPHIASSFTTGLPLITPGSHSNYSMTQMPEKLVRVGPHTSTNGISNMFPASGITSADDLHMEPILISDVDESDKYGISEFIPVTAELRNTGNQLSGGDGSTINLLQLSSQLQHVEHQRQYMQVKQEDDTLFGLRIT